MASPPPSSDRHATPPSPVPDERIFSDVLDWVVSICVPYGLWLIIGTAITLFVFTYLTQDSTFLLLVWWTTFAFWVLLSFIWLWNFRKNRLHTQQMHRWKEDEPENYTAHLVYPHNMPADWAERNPGRSAADYQDELPHEYRRRLRQNN